MNKINTFVIPIIRSDFISNCLETMHKNTPDNFYVIVIDQTPNNKAYFENHFKTHLWIRSYRNLGFSKAMNTGIKLAQTEYITLCNDDVEFLDTRWWQGIVDTFQQDHHILAVNPMSPKEGAWGYGLRDDNKNTWIPPEHYTRNLEDTTAIIPVWKNGMAFTKADAQTQEGYDFLVNNHPRYRKDTMVDAIAGWMPIYKKTAFEKLGLLDEKFYPGGGEDYDMNCRAYSCAYPQPREECNNEYHYRMVSTSKSWVWHFGGKSKDAISAKDPDNKLFSSRERWNNNAQLWGEKFDVWGHEHIGDKKKPLVRISSPFIDEL